MWYVLPGAYEREEALSPIWLDLSLDFGTLNEAEVGPDGSLLDPYDKKGTFFLVLGVWRRDRQRPGVLKGYPMNPPFGYYKYT